jgi:hypothetical protein
MSAFSMSALANRAGVRAENRTFRTRVFEQFLPPDRLLSFYRDGLGFHTEGLIGERPVFVSGHRFAGYEGSAYRVGACYEIER